MNEKSEQIFDIFRVGIKKSPKRIKIKKSKGLGSSVIAYLCFTSKRAIIGFAEEKTLGAEKYLIPYGLLVDAYLDQKKLYKKLPTMKQMDPEQIIIDNENNFEIPYSNISNIELKNALLYKLKFSTIDGEYIFNVWMVDEFGKKYLTKKHAKPLWDRLVNASKLAVSEKLIVKE